MKRNIIRFIFPLVILLTLIIAAILITHQPIQKKSTEVFPVSANNLIATQNDLFEVEEEPKLESTVLMEKVAVYPEFDFTHVSKIAYMTENVSYKNNPYDDAEDIAELNKYDEVLLTGQNDLKYWEIEINRTKYYIDSTKITTDESVVDELKEQDRIAEEKRLKEEQERKAREEKETLKNQTQSYTWNGSVLTPSKGVNYGPSGKETYYNLPMEGVIQIMRNMGNTDEYWIRDDGCKMLGNYIMVAANLQVHPRGSLVETSLGTGIVCDTGGFAVNNPTQLDIAVNW